MRNRRRRRCFKWKLRASCPSEVALASSNARMARMVAWVEPRVPSANLCVEIHVSACFTDCGDVPAFINAMAQRAVHSVFREDPDEIHLPPGPEGIVRYKKLKLGKNTRQKRRYYLPDLIRWLN